MLEAGFTSVRDVGNEGNYACVSVKRAIDAGKIPGPTMITAGRIIAPYGGQFTLQPDKPGLGEPEYFFADSRDEMQKAVRQNAHFGASVIKIVVDDQRYIYSEDDIRFIKEEAARAGLKLAAHAWTERGAHNAAAAGVTSIEHLNSVTDADLEAVKRNGVTAVFTPFPLPVLLQQQLSKDEAQKQYQNQIARLGSARRLGVVVAYGTDAISELPGMTRGESAIQWIDSYVEAGFSAKELLKAMVPTAAALFGVEKERGAIRPQMAADIIATPGNPLDDISVLKRVSFVMKNGRIVKSSGKGSE
jgi:imidazolonepropionase-like amidohydrolase